MDQDLRGILMGAAVGATGCGYAVWMCPLGSYPSWWPMVAGAICLVPLTLYWLDGLTRRS